MAGNSTSEGLGDDFFEQILAVPEAPVGYGRTVATDVGMLQLGSTTPTAAALRGGGMMPLGLNLEQSAFLSHHDSRNLVDDVVNVDPTVHNNHHHHHHHQHLTLHNNNSSPSSTAPITVCTHHLHLLLLDHGLVRMQIREWFYLFYSPVHNFS